jgi:quinol monooxygenase YgiN
MGEHPVLVAVRKKLTDPTQPFVIQTEVKVGRGLGSRFADAIWDHWTIWNVRNEPGCDGYNICRDNDAPESFLIRESWLNLEALKAHIASPQFVTVERALRIFAEDPPVVRVMTSVADEAQPKPKRSKKAQETAPPPAAKPGKLDAWLKYQGVRYPMRTGKAYFDGKALSLVARDKKGKYHIKIRCEPVYGKVGRAALSPDCLGRYGLEHATVRVGGRSWHVNISEVMLRSDEKGLEMGGQLGLYGQDDAPATDHMTSEEEDKFLCDYYINAKFHEGKIWFQIKAKWVAKEQMEAEGIETEKKDE